MKKENKIIILHDTFLYKGGGERLMIMMQKALQSDLATGFISKGSFDLKTEGVKGKIIEVSSEIFKAGFRHIKLKFAFLFKTKFLSKYNTVIFSGDCLSAVRNCKSGTKKIYYCHTPPRYLYDLRGEYLKKVKWYLRPAFEILSYIFKKMYESDIRKMDLIITNSKNTGARLKSFLGYDSVVVYPPVELDRFKFVGQGDYYMSASRLSSAKRINNIIEAFKRMPDKKILLAYGENDPQKDEYFELAKGFENIIFKTFPGNIGFTEAIGNSIAGIGVPIDEDFGMVSVESMAAGKPFLAVDEGGFKESVIHKKTGFLIPKGGYPDDIVKAIKYLTPEKCLEMKNDCEKRALEFSYEEFEIQINSYVNN